MAGCVQMPGGKCFSGTWSSPYQMSEPLFLAPWASLRSSYKTYIGFFRRDLQCDYCLVEDQKWSFVVWNEWLMLFLSIFLSPFCRLSSWCLNLQLQTSEEIPGEERELIYLFLFSARMFTRICNEMGNGTGTNSGFGRDGFRRDPALLERHGKNSPWVLASSGSHVGQKFKISEDQSTSEWRGNNPKIQSKAPGDWL